MCWCSQLHHGQTWLSQPLSVSTVPNTGRNLPNSSYRGLDEEDYSLYRGLFAVLSLRYECLLYSKALFINNNCPHLLHDLLVWDTMNELHRRNTLYNRWGYTMQIVPLHADFSCPHCWAAYLIKICLRVTSDGQIVWVACSIALRATCFPTLQVAVTLSAPVSASITSMAFVVSLFFWTVASRSTIEDLPLGAHVQSTCTRVVDIQIGKKD